MFVMSKTIKNLTEFGLNVGFLRKKYHPDLSLSRAAMKALLGYRQLEKIEAGLTDPHFSTIVRISESWGIPLLEFFEKEEPDEVAKKKKSNARAGN